MDFFKNIIHYLVCAVVIIISYVTPAAGFVGHFYGISMLVYIGGIEHIVETFIQYGRGVLNNSAYASMWFVIMVSIAVSIIIKCNIWYGVCFGMCLEGFFYTIISVIPMFVGFIASLFSRT